MVSPDSDYAAFRSLRQLKPVKRELKPVLSDEDKAALEERKKKLVEEQEQRTYKQMVSNVASERHNKEDEYGHIWREMNRQGTAVFNTLITVGGAFTFAFYGIQMMIPGIDFPYKIISGLILGGIVFIADLYFIMKSM
ncbi:hypothetical protein FO519_005817 [Halicephalobus sp. NKZ332]|nr:hypothetical protein FO519_005817 [Halicephalobus sp. NKZ332]